MLFRSRKSTAYDAEGRVVATWGSTYPVAYEYDAFGRMAAMATTRDPVHESVNLLTLLPVGVNLSDASHPSYPATLDTTRWLYHEPTGLLTNKVYADGKGTAYAYTPDGKLSQRSWARGINTGYTYDSSGSLTNILYSDCTPAVTFAYDRLGRQLSTITAGVSTNLFAYDAATLALTNELVIAFGETNVLSRAQDALGRPSSIALGSAYAAAYGYDELGRFSQVAATVGASVVTNTYSYISGSNLIAGWSNDFVTVSRAYEPHRDLLTQMLNVSGGVIVSQYDYANDSLGRRTLRADSGSAFGVATTNAFGYNIRSEVESALMGTNQYGYVFDPIGNRKRASLNVATNLYAANALNQYTNVLSAMPPRADTPVYDEDGNILRLRDWTLEWDGENRLCSASNATTLVTYVHDFQSRRVGRKQYTWDTDHWTLTTDHRFLYDGWALIRETINDQQSAITNHFVYGLDLSDSLQGAGTIGGILSANLNGEPVFYAYDGNGNVTDLVDTNGVVVEHYEYSPFGETIAQSRHPAFTQSQPFRFSTKRRDEATGLLYYGYRDLDTVWGRWLSRDPIWEIGGLNLYAVVRNRVSRNVDYLGLISQYVKPCEDINMIWKQGKQTGDPIIDRLVDMLRRRDCRFKMTCKPCCSFDDCYSHTARGCAWESRRTLIGKPMCNMTVCGNRYRNAPISDVKGTIRHELTHCLQICDDVYDDQGDCKRCLCNEMEAYYNGRERVLLPPAEWIRLAMISCGDVGRACENKTPPTFSASEIKACLGGGLRLL